MTKRRISSGDREQLRKLVALYGADVLIRNIKQIEKGAPRARGRKRQPLENLEGIYGFVKHHSQRARGDRKLGIKGASGMLAGLVRDLMPEINWSAGRVTRQFYEAKRTLSSDRLARAERLYASNTNTKTLRLPHFSRNGPSGRKFAIIDTKHLKTRNVNLSFTTATAGLDEEPSTLIATPCRQKTVDGRRQLKSSKNSPRARSSAG